MALKKGFLGPISSQFLMFLRLFVFRAESPVPTWAGHLLSDMRTER